MAHPLGDRFEDALSFAAHLHRTQVRKSSPIPYVAHLLAVCALVIEDGGDEDEAIAALLHDAVEDQGGAPCLAEIRVRYGDRVADIVDGCSDTDQQPKPPWRQRKEAYLAHLAHPATSPSVLRVSVADKLHNARSVLLDQREIGDAVWERFTAGRDAQLWYYRSLVDVLRDRFPGRLTDQLTETVEALAGG